MATFTLSGELMLAVAAKLVALEVIVPKTPDSPQITDLVSTRCALPVVASQDAVGHTAPIVKMSYCLVYVWPLSGSVAVL